MTPPNGGNQRLKKIKVELIRIVQKRQSLSVMTRVEIWGAVHWSECSVKEHFCFLPPVEAKAFSLISEKTKSNNADGRIFKQDQRCFDPTYKV